VTCSTCQDKGLVRVNWQDADPDFAVCLCATGLSLRVDRNYTAAVSPRWHVWCAREQVDPSRVWMLEDILTPQELAERGFGVAPDVRVPDREAALLAAGKTRKGARL
jgi:hypothetical protein